MRLKLVILILAIIGIGWYSYSYYQSRQPVVDSYESCVIAKGSVIQESYPATCITSANDNFTQPIPSPSSQQDQQIWKNYTNSDYGFSLKYPPEFTLTEESGGLEIPASKITDKQPYYIFLERIDTLPHFRISINPEGFFGRQFSHENLDREGIANIANREVKVIYEDNDGHPSDGRNQTRMYIDFKSNNLPNISIYARLPLPTNKYESQLYQILQSFSFTDN